MLEVRNKMLEFNSNLHIKCTLLFSSKMQIIQGKLWTKSSIIYLYIEERVKKPDKVERSILLQKNGAVAQLARAPALQAGGQEFDSPQLHQI